MTLSKVTNFFNKFNEKLFRTQLAFFEDIDYSEQIEYIEGFEKKDDAIKQFLEKISLSWLFIFYITFLPKKF